MKYLVLSDIHGNIVALEAILNKVPASRYDKILVLGDNIGDGPSPDKVISTLLAHNAIMIAGNREELGREHFMGLGETQHALQWKFMRDSIACLDGENKKYVMEAPNQMSIKDGNISIRLVHGSPQNVRELLYYYKTNRLNECLDSIEENILLCGHNHYQFSYLHNDKLVLNPGSVGLSQKGEAFRADYAILNVSENQFSFELNHVYYDGNKIKQEYIDRNLWDSSIWGQIAFEEMAHGKMYIIGFARFVFNLAKERNVSTHPLDDSVWLEACEKWDWKPAD